MGKKRNFVAGGDVDDIIERHRVATGLGVSEAICDLIRKGWRLENLDAAQNALIPIIREIVAGYAAPALARASMDSDERCESVLAATDDIKKLLLMGIYLVVGPVDTEALLAASKAANDLMDGMTWT